MQGARSAEPETYPEDRRGGEHRGADRQKGNKSRPRASSTDSSLSTTKCKDKANQADYWDTEVNGFGVTVDKKTKICFALRRVNGRRVRTTSGHCNVMTLKQACDRAAELLVEIKQGVNPKRRKKELLNRGITFREALVL